MWRKWSLLLVLLVCALLGVATISPFSASARDYGFDGVEIAAEILPDGSLHVRETRTFVFDGLFSTVWWQIPDLYSGSVLVANGAEVDYSPVEEINFDPKWRATGGPDGSYFSFDKERNTIYVFFPHRNGSVPVTIDYTVENAVQKYEDVAELYWKFVGPDWQVDSRNVELTVSFPGAADGPVPEGDFRVWAHGPLDGFVRLNSQARTVSASVSRVVSGEFAEVRVVFPTQWVSEIEPGGANSHAFSVLDSILKQEQEAADQANRQRFLMKAALVGPLVFSVFVFLVSGFIWLSGALRRPVFSDKYWRDSPAAGLDGEFGVPPDLHPAAVGFNYERGKFKESIFNACILRLINLGWVSLTPVSGGSNFKKDWVLRSNVEAVSESLHPIDRQVSRIIFYQVADGSPTVKISEFGKFAKKYPALLSMELRVLEKLIKKEAEWAGLTSERLSATPRFILVANLCSAAISIIFMIWVFLDTTRFFSFLAPRSYFDFLLAAAPALAIVVSALASYFSSSFETRSDAGLELHARSKSLRRWLLDFTRLDERPPTDVRVWGTYVTYAVLFGVSKTFVSNLEKLDSDVLQDPRVLSSAQFIGYRSAGAASFTSSPSALLSRSFKRVSFSGFSSRSSGSGSGGGFSSGGGGGFGGGGGGAR
ncbi:MAG: DUF2207 domain-containing protein [Actinomycetaceae bacterium]|nr:DUF2207 domain-containing protein [Actinomycetaceae bacterium]